MSEQVLDIEFTSIVRDCPRGTRVAEPVGMYPVQVRPRSRPAQELLESVGLEPLPGPESAPLVQGRKQGPGDRTPEVEIVFQGSVSAIGEGNGALFLALGMEDPEATRVEIAVG